MTSDNLSKSILIIGGSAGSLHVVLGLLTAIPAGFPMPVLIVLHRNGVFESSLEDLLATRTTVPIREVEEKRIRYYRAPCISVPRTIMCCWRKTTVFPLIIRNVSISAGPVST